MTSQTSNAFKPFQYSLLHVFVPERPAAIGLSEPAFDFGDKAKIRRSIGAYYIFNWAIGVYYFELLRGHSRNNTTTDFASSIINFLFKFQFWEFHSPQRLC